MDIKINKNTLVNVRRVLVGTDSEYNHTNMKLADVVKHGYHSTDRGTVSVRIEKADGKFKGNQIYYSNKLGGWFLDCRL